MLNVLHITADMTVTAVDHTNNRVEVDPRPIICIAEDICEMTGFRTKVVRILHADGTTTSEDLGPC